MNDDELACDGTDGFTATLTVTWPQCGLLQAVQRAALSAVVIKAVRAHAKGTGVTFAEALEALTLAGARLEATASPSPARLTRLQVLDALIDDLRWRRRAGRQT